MAVSDGLQMHIDLTRDRVLQSIDLACAYGAAMYDYCPFGRDIGEGGVELVMVNRDIGYGHGWCRVDGGTEVRARIEVSGRCLQFVFHLSPEPSVVQLDGAHYPTPFGIRDSLILGPLTAGTQVFSPGTRAEEISFLVDAALIESLFEERGATMPRSLKAVLCCPERGSPVPSGITTGEMRRTIHDILRTDMDGSLLAIYRDAKVHELLALRLGQIAPFEIEPRKLLLMQGDLNLLDYARGLLESHFIDPPTISELVRTVGLNRTKLKAGFKEVYGTTIFGFVRSKRLQHALQLLRAGSCNVGEAANRVGYRSLSAFTRAFHSEFGFGARSVLMNSASRLRIDSSDSLRFDNSSCQLIALPFRVVRRTGPRAMASPIRISLRNDGPQ